MCLHMPPWRKRNDYKDYPTKAVLDQFMTNMEAEPSIAMQYFAGENGIVTVYPASKISKKSRCVYTDIRLR